ncbi:hypothetical protein [Sandarakinorhabdus sp. DWP1-3-1]|uniref:hypothetical protein n=1 Tax=Sandarakinorhabdus sp. DWP1-3-1 TaxID=2804627 RepID=UPI003CE91C03
MRRVATILLLISPLAPVQAQSAAELARCVAIARDADRLACYDTALANSSPEARAASEVRARESARIAAEEAVAAAAAAKASAEAEAKARREAFGAEAVASRPDRFKPRADEIREVEAGVAELLTNRSGLGVFLLDNGQLWRQADTQSLPNVRVGDRVKISKTTLGGYNMTFLKQKRAALVKRVR